MGAHPDAARRDLAQQRIEIGAVAPLMNRIDPDENAIERGELCAGFENIVLVDHRFGIDADIGKRREDGLEPAGLWRSVRRAASSPRHRIATRPRRLWTRTLGLDMENGSAFILMLPPARVRGPRAGLGREPSLRLGSLRCPDIRYIRLDTPCDQAAASARLALKSDRQPVALATTRWPPMKPACCGPKFYGCAPQSQVRFPPGSSAGSGAPAVV